MTVMEELANPPSSELPVWSVTPPPTVMSGVAEFVVTFLVETEPEIVIAGSVETLLKLAISTVPDAE